MCWSACTAALADWQCPATPPRGKGAVVQGAVMLCPIMKKTRLPSAKIQGGQCVCVWVERVGEWTNIKAIAFYLQWKGKSGRIWKGTAALQLSVMEVYGIERDERLVLVENFVPKCFFLQDDYSLVLKGLGFVWNSHPCIQSVRRACVHLTILVFSCFLVPDAYILRFKCRTLKFSPLPAPDQTLIIQSSISWIPDLVNGSFTVSV